jgi:hypothetical protein
MRGNANLFEEPVGAGKMGTPRYIFMLLLLIVLSAWLLANTGITAGLAILLLPLIVVYLYWLFKKPIIGLYTAVSLGFILLGITRYLTSLSQMGMVMDGILILTYIALIFNKFTERVDWTPAKKDITALSAIWFGYALLQFFNPEAISHQAWLAGMRGISMYMFLMVPLVLLFLDDIKKINVFLYVWGIWSILTTLKGIMQLMIGPDPWEKAWLDSGGAITHIIYGNLRVFSFLSDAAQFGSTQGYAGVVFGIIALGEKEWRKKVFYATVAILGFYGMFISGTRGAISVPLGGFMLYFVLRKNWYVMITGIILLSGVYIFFKYTTIAQGNQQIRRMRSAFDPNDPSLQVRLENQRILRIYLASRPFGGGIGHAGVKAQQYLPNAFLSQIATDSWYVLIWAEQGIVGLVLHIFILLYVIIRASWLIMMKIRDPVLKVRMIALASGMMGIMVASYGNAALGTMPTAMMIYTSMALMLNSDVIDKNITDSTKMSSQQQLST